jgi:hypothetical protein
MDESGQFVVFFLKKEAALTPVCLNAMPGTHRIDRGASGGFSTVEVAIKNVWFLGTCPGSSPAPKSASVT